MTDTNHPPRVADWLLFLFVSKGHAPPILGDLREEFSAVASQRGMYSARLWYWRQVAKTVPHLFYAQLVLESLQVFTAVAASLLLLALAYMPLYAVLPRDFPATDWPESLRLALLCIWLCLPFVQYILPPMLVGWIVARASRGRDMVVTIVFSCATFSLGMIAALVLTQRWFWAWTNSYPHLAPTSSFWSLFWLAHPYAAIIAPIGTFIGGLIARKMAPALGKPGR